LQCPTQLDAKQTNRSAEDPVLELEGGYGSESDISFNVIGIPHLQGAPLVDLPVDDFAESGAKTHFLTAKVPLHAGCPRNAFARSCCRSLLISAIFNMAEKVAYLSFMPNADMFSIA